jgi:hypothetical protein
MELYVLSSAPIPHNTDRLPLKRAGNNRHVEEMINDGVTVLPLLTETETTLFRESFIAAQKAFPEFLHDNKAEKLPFTMGGFGAYGNPSSFHNGYIRTLRLYTALPMLRFFRELKDRLGELSNTDDYPIREETPIKKDGKWYFQMLFDRMCMRPKGSSISAESPHRDLNPQLVTKINDKSDKYLPSPYDYVFGGWINLDSRGRDQKFTCVKGTHKDYITLKKNTRAESGFATEEPSKVKHDTVIVPPGHIVVFFQRLLHIVTPNEMKYDSFRQFRCWRITHSVEQPLPLNGLEEMNRCINDFAVPLLPSSQWPPMYSKNHSSSFLFSEDKNDPRIWTKNKVKRVCYDKERTCNGKKNKGRKYILCERFMRSMRELGFHQHVRVYGPREEQWLRPGRKWLLPSPERVQYLVTNVKDVLSMKLIKELEKKGGKKYRF